MPRTTYLECILPWRSQARNEVSSVLPFCKYSPHGLVLLTGKCNKLQVLQVACTVACCALWEKLQHCLGLLAAGVSILWHLICSVLSQSPFPWDNDWVYFFCGSGSSHQVCRHFIIILMMLSFTEISYWIKKSPHTHASLLWWVHGSMPREGGCHCQTGRLVSAPVCFSLSVQCCSQQSACPHLASVRSSCKFTVCWVLCGRRGKFISDWQSNKKCSRLARFPNEGTENQWRYQGVMKCHQMADVMCN